MSNNEIFANARSVDIFSDFSDEEKAQSRFRAQVATSIHEKRIAMGMTQNEFGEYMGVKQSVVSKWENGDINFTMDALSSYLSKIGLCLNISFSPACEPSPQSNSYCACSKSSSWPLLKASPSVAYN